MIILGVDTGGTFTDFFLQRGEEILTYKIPSTPDDPARAIMEGLAHFFPELPPGLEIIHGSTVGTNAFLERKGARTLLVTTHGFEDVLFIGRQNRPALYDFQVNRPAEIIPRSQCVGVKERMSYEGKVLKPLGSTVGRRLRALCRKGGIEAVAVCLLHSYANPVHEQRIGEMLARLSIPVTLSSDILPEFREYERTTTTVINSYLAPVISSYIERLAGKLRGRAPLHIQLSNGGLLPAEEIGSRAVYTVLSGPAGGVHGADQLARQMGLDKIITFDMGGTSTDVSLCEGGPTLTREYQIDGYPVRTQVLDIHTVGAGGGSIAYIDAGGLLRVGPESSGADPGPVCYGKGDRIAVTDANLYLGRLLADRFLGGAMRLDRAAVELYMQALAERIDLSATDTALGIIRIVNANMAKAIRAVSLERGHDPKEFVLFGFGGASGLHCCELAEELGIGRIVIPARAGVLSAQGMVYADPFMDYLQSLFLNGKQIDKRHLAEPFARLEQKARAEAEILGGGAGGTRATINRFLNLRYQGQSYELCIPCDGDFVETFHQIHEQTYGYRLDDMELELVSIQCGVRVVRDKQPLPRQKAMAGGEPQAEGKTPVVFATGRKMIPYYLRHRFSAGQDLEGPALIVDDYTTVLLTEGFRLNVDELLNLVIERQNR